MPDPGAVAFLQTRMALFYLLQSAYAAPLTPDVADSLTECFTVYGALLDWEGPGLDPWDPDRDSPEFYRLFVGPGSLIAPPYESIYRSLDGLLMQAETLSVRAAYQEAGLQKREGQGEPDDHLPLELEFYARLQYQALSAYQASDWAAADQLLATQAQFHKDHLNRWVPAFCTKVLAGSLSPFYRSLARLTRETLRTETQVLSAVTSLIATEGGANHERAI